MSTSVAPDAPVSSGQMMLFAPRFLETHAGSAILNDPIVALVELVANAWDATATRVEITWPNRKSDQTFSIADDGHGMTAEEFGRRWMTLSYDRREEQGAYSEMPLGSLVPKRLAFGRNGVGRHGVFAFGETYEIFTRKAGFENIFRVSKGRTSPLDVEHVSTTPKDGHGTVIRVAREGARFPLLEAKDARAEIGLRFLTDPLFSVFVDGKKVEFGSVPSGQINSTDITIPNLGVVHLITLDTRATDKTARQHGVAWQVSGRPVGECSWKGTGHGAFLDGRRVEARRYTFIVQADFLGPAVKPDWRGFYWEHPDFRVTNDAVQAEIRGQLIELTKDKRAATTAAVRKAHSTTLAEMTARSIEKWNAFVNEAQEACPSITERELTQLAGVLANLEIAKSGYGLLSQLHQLEPTAIDDLNRILSEWTLDYAKLVLDELQVRLKLVDELRAKVSDPKTREVQDLQPLFHKGLWIFGPEYETIEFTSNQGMTRVIQNLFASDVSGTKLRPDFAILPDGTAGLYSYPKYDRDGNETGVDRLTIVELKKPGLSISTDQKAQAWKYVKELYDKGLLRDYSVVTCFVLGTSIDPNEASVRTEKDGKVTISPVDYETVLVRAKSRLLKLYDRVRNAPFLDRSVIAEYLKPTNPELNLFDDR